MAAGAHDDEVGLGVGRFLSDFKAGRAHEHLLRERGEVRFVLQLREDFFGGLFVHRADLLLREDFREARGERRADVDELHVGLFGFEPAPAPYQEGECGMVVAGAVDGHQDAHGGSSERLQSIHSSYALKAVPDRENGTTKRRFLTFPKAGREGP